MRTTLHRRHGLSLLEVCVLVAAIGLLMVFALSLLNAKAKAHRIHCLSNLKHIGLANLLYANDHGEKFPWMVSTDFNPTNASGSREFTNSAQVFRHLQAASNELNTPKVLRCPSDAGRQTALDFVNFGNRNVGYFVGLDAAANNQGMLLSGDRNITGATFANPNLLLVRNNSSIAWTKSIHMSQGNVGLADGSIGQMTTPSLNKQIAAVTNAVFRLAIP